MSRLLAWVTSILLLFLVAEGLTRLLTTATPLEPDARLGWKYKTHVHQTRSTDGKAWDFRTSEERLRAPDGYGLGPKAPGEFRILLLGDSFTLGWGLDPDETFASKLEEKLASAGTPATVIPAGIEAYSTDQECLWLEEHGARYQPDVVIVLPYVNDVVWNAQPRYLTSAKPLFILGDDGSIHADPGPVAGPPWWIRYSRLISKVQSIRTAFASQIPVPPEFGGGRLQLDDFPFLKKETPQAKEGWRETAAIAKRLVEKARGLGASTVCAAPIPSRFEVYPVDAAMFARSHGCELGALDFAKPTQKLAETFAGAGATVLDAVSPVLATAARERLYFEGVDWHFNARGAEVFAGGLHAALEKAGALPPKGARAAGATLASGGAHAAGGIPTWAFVVAGLWIALSIGFKVAYPDESVIGAFVKVGLLAAFVVAVVAGVTAGAAALPPPVKILLFVVLIGGLAIYAIVKTRSRFGTIRELFGALVDRGHWYLVPMLVVMLTISVLLVVAQNPIVAPFIYTLF